MRSSLQETVEQMAFVVDRMDDARMKEVEMEAQEINKQLESLEKLSADNNISSLPLDQMKVLSEVQHNLEGLSPLMPHLDEILERLNQYKETVDEEAHMHRRIEELTLAQESLKTTAAKNQKQMQELQINMKANLDAINKNITNLESKIN